MTKQFFQFLPEHFSIAEGETGLRLEAAQPIPNRTDLGYIRIHFKQGAHPIAGRRFVRIAGWSELVNENRETPNCTTIKTQSETNPTVDHLVSVWSIQDIKAGDEITWAYTLEEYEGAPWRSAKQSYGATNGAPERPPLPTFRL